MAGKGRRRSPNATESNRSLGRHSAERDTSGVTRRLLQTMPVVLAGSLILTMAAPVTAYAEPTKRTPKANKSQARLPLSTITAAARKAVRVPAQAGIAAPPAKYTVVPGDSVSSIASRHGLSTASVLALNGLGWKSLIFPGQVLSLGGTAAPVAAPAPAQAAPAAAAAGSYAIKRGDTVSAIAARFGMSTQSLLTANGLSWRSIIYPGQLLKIPAAATSAAPVQSAATAPSVAPAAAPAAPPEVQLTSITYTIAAGDTVTSIAAKFGVTIASVLESNGLRLSSVIFVGRTLTIVGPVRSVPSVVGAQAGLTVEQVSVAKTIISVGRSLGVSDQGIVIALAAAAQESTLRNLSYGDRDSVGVFQQRPSAGWGTVTELTTVEHATRLFYGGPGNPRIGITRGLLDIPGWQGMTVTRAAQAVQNSAYPDAYAKWETSARSWLATLG